MDFGSVIQQLNWLAIVISAFSTFIIGGIWYSPLLFEKGWMSSNNFIAEDLQGRNMPVVFGTAFILAFIMALNLTLFIGNEANLAFGIIAGFLTGIGWVLPSMGIIALFEKRSMKYFLINGGYILISFIVMGTILGTWK